MTGWLPREETSGEVVGLLLWLGPDWTAWLVVGLFWLALIGWSRALQR